MAYDPFAPPPTAGQMATTSLPVQMPPGLAPNNVLGNLPLQMFPGGGFGIPGTPGGPPNTQFPLNPGAGGQGQQFPNWMGLGPLTGNPQGFDRGAFQQARTDWRAGRQQGGDPQQMADWRGQRPHRSDYYTPPGA